MKPGSNKLLKQLGGALKKEMGSGGPGAAISMPDDWELNTLSEFDKRAGQGEPYLGMVASEVVEEGGTRYYHFMKAIAVKPVCLVCHGNKDTIPAEVKAKLATEYPLDQATGYQEGGLRGAVSIKQPMDIPLR